MDEANVGKFFNDLPSSLIMVLIAYCISKALDFFAAKIKQYHKKITRRRAEQRKEEFDKHLQMLQNEVDVFTRDKTYFILNRMQNFLDSFNSLLNLIKLVAIYYGISWIFRLSSKGILHEFFFVLFVYLFIREFLRIHRKMLELQDIIDMATVVQNNNPEAKKLTVTSSNDGHANSEQ